MKRVFTFILTALLCLGAYAQKFDDLAKTPQMGWNSWNKFASNVDEKVIRETIDTMVEMGLVDAGYVYINVDDFWHGVRGDDGFISENKEKFPSGLKALVDYAHSKGLKFGIYSDAGTNTCGGCPGSLGHEYQDAIRYAEWGIDYLKYDWCYTPNVDPKGAYKLMSNALAAAGHPIFFSMCEWGNNKPWLWASEIGHSWRTTGDITASFDTDVEHFDPGNYWKQLSVLTILDLNEPLRQYAGPGHWNDPDMLEVGNGMSVSEDRAHFTMWCMMAAPLLLGNDLTAMSDEVKAIILNKDVIAIDQDPLGVQGLRYRKDGDLEFWFKPLEGGDWAFTILNRGKEDRWYTVDWNQFIFTDELSGRNTGFDSTIYSYVNLWDKSQTGTTAGEFKTAVMGHDVVTLRLTPKNKRLTAKFDTDKQMLFYAPDKASVTVNVANPADKRLKGKLTLKLMTDKYEPLKTFTKSINLAAGSSSAVKFEFPLEPGFYRTEVSVNGGTPDCYNIGFEPEKVISATDRQPDFQQFWDKARAELKSVAPEFKLELVPEECTPTNAVYKVSMKSLGGVTIYGYYSEPIGEGPYPVMIEYMGYGSGSYYPNKRPDAADFILSVRGQAIDQPNNVYGNWIEYRLDDPEQYYYRGAFMDVIRAIDFVCSRPKVDQSKIFARGGSQGGAFTFAACALDVRIAAAAPDVPFLGDYPDYFQIVGWPASDVFNGQKKYGLSDEELYRNLSYFDIKNLAEWVSCPILMAFGLQDETCPPHTNFASYNNVPATVDKSYVCYKLSGHAVWLIEDWYKRKDEFFARFTK